ncbi:MAG: lysine--tRNA ligase [Candidatus Parcubacteria bacterium]|nr:MAG: lysine--tRNA ligase [Candidatus Parcubacteria bacterium]
MNFYPEKVPAKTNIDFFINNFSKFLKNKKRVWLIGRIMAVREHGKITFLKLQDFYGSIQIILKENAVKDYQGFLDLVKIGDFFAFYGYAFLPRTKEKSLLAEKWLLAAKSIKNFPKEYYKVRDEELLVREPYLKTIFYPEEKETFYLRFKLIEELRKILWSEGFLEVETPILQTHYGGALARPFVTYLEAMKEPLYLRIAPEIYLKKMLVGGFEKIFEIGKDFRNEGIDKEHNPEFTMMELYWAYQDREGLMKFTERIIKELVKRYKSLKGEKGLKIIFQDKVIDLSKKWQAYKYIELLKKETGLDYFGNSLDDFLKLAKEKNIEFNPKIITKGKIVDEIFKKLIRPKLIQPTFLIDHPKEISPLAKSHPDDPRLTLRFQIYLAGFEIANAFAELNDPVDQKQRFEESVKELKKGDVEAHPYDETFISALEYGMPPTAGLGIGIDRLLTIILNKRSIQDIIYFPFVKRK